MKTTVISRLTGHCQAVFRAGVLPALAFVLLGGPVATALRAQETAKTTSATETKYTDDKVIVLDPFRVQYESDVGYGARQTTIGNRVVKPISEIPSSISVINQEMLTDLGATSALHVLQYGTAGSTPTNEINDDINMRGFRTMLQLRDGILFNTNRKNPMFDVERVEVIKGPAGMLVGATAYLGGVVNYVTKSPTTKNQGMATLTVGDDKSLIRATVNQSGPLKQSEDFTALYRVTLGYEDYDGKKSNLSSERTFIGAGLTFKFFKERARLDVNAFYFIDNGLEYYNDFLDLNRSPIVAAGVNLPMAVLNDRATDSFVISPKSQNYEDTRTRYVNALFTASLTENGSMRLSYTGTDYKDRRRIVRGITLRADNTTIDRQDLYQAYDFPQHILQWEYLYRSIFSFAKNDFQVGADSQWLKNRTGTLILTPPPLNTASPDYTYNAAPVDLITANFANGDTSAITTSGSWWFQDNVTLLNDKLILVGGLRWSDSIVKTTNLRNQPNTLSVIDNPRVQTHRWGAVFKPFGNQLSLYFADAENITPNLGTDSFGVPFKDSAGTMKEYGLKFEKKLDRVSVYGSLAFFDMALTNVRTSALDPVFGIIIVQTKQDSAEGWEFETGGRLTTDSGHADVMLTYSDLNSVRAADDGWNPEAPETTYSVFAKYSWTSSSLKGLTVGGGFYDQSKKRTGNTYYVDYPVTYSVLARYDVNPRWSLQLNGDNITDERYITTIATPGLVLTALGAQYKLTATLRW